MWYISNKYWLPNKSAKKSCYTWHFTPLFNIEKIYALDRRSFQKHPLFTTFLLVFTVGEVSNISRKYWPPKKLSKILIFSHKRPSLHFQKKISFLYRKGNSKHPLFTTFLIVSEIWYFSNKYWLSNKSADKNIFTQVILHPCFISQKGAQSIAEVSKKIYFLPHFY